MILESIILGICLCTAAGLIRDGLVIAAKIRMGEKYKLEGEE